MISLSEVVDDLLRAERERKPLPPFTEAHRDFDVGSAYEAQRRLVAAKERAGDPVVGAKLGLTSRAKQEAMGVDHPLYGWVTGSMLLPFGEPVALETLIQPRVEPEIAFRLKADVPTPATVTGVLNATESVFAAIDVLDSRYEDYRFTLADVVADNCSAGRFLLGPVTRDPAALGDLRLVGCVLRVDGEVAATAAGAAVMGHPAASVAWLANRLAVRGEVLKAGSLVFSGGLTAPVPLRRGRSISAEFDGLGAIEVVGS
ncbi:2-keto-4-pentenoate hydratase [Pseudonocardia sp.]|uniref:2-keto-4-pentenoate hydratase n=1 Tax=Pseudonocardia sp. TaxID=60912 RepID=UPI003D0B9C07